MRKRHISCYNMRPADRVFGSRSSATSVFCLTSTFRFFITAHAVEVHFSIRLTPSVTSFSNLSEKGHTNECALQLLSLTVLGKVQLSCNAVFWLWGYKRLGDKQRERKREQMLPPCWRCKAESMLWFALIRSNSINMLGSS